LQPATEGWKTQVRTCSALNNIDIDTVWSTVNEFVLNTKESGVFEKRRKSQILEWVYSMIEDNLKTIFYSNPLVKQNMPDIKSRVMKGDLTPALAVEELLSYFGKA
jgi:LAO/AO transport system kinase